MARRRARLYDLPFNIDESDIVVPDVCPLLGIPLARSRGPSPGSPSVDRLIPALGYVKGNVWVISNRANSIKSNATPEELERIAAGVRARLLK